MDRVYQNISFSHQYYKFIVLWKPRSFRRLYHNDVIKWKHFPRYWPFMRWIHRSPVNSPHKGQWRRTLIFSLICTRINGWVNYGEAGDLRRHCVHYDVTVMQEISMYNHLWYHIERMDNFFISHLINAMRIIYFKNPHTTYHMPWHPISPSVSQNLCPTVERIKTRKRQENVINMG